ncbi:MAG: hypothetical protein GWP91_06655 [Rhodobacterales bacterium]|nr:hypothetical protein [Rhodobacterales bacterium]
MPHPRLPFVLLFLCATACDDPLIGTPIVDEDNPDALIYTPDWDGITELSENHCQSCHAPGGSADFMPLPEALALDLDAEAGRFVVPFEPDASKLWRVTGGVLADTDVGDMPLGGRLAHSQIGHIELWILDGAPHPMVVQDNDNDGVSPEDGDCDDTDASIFPGADELCEDGIDNNCDGQIDDPTAVDATTSYQDLDQDGYGDTASPLTQCGAIPTGYAELSGDCDDTNVAFNPGVIEADCRDASDYNCDGAAFGVDADADGSFACDDCDDTDDTVFPGATERCDAVDHDCDGDDQLGATDTTLWYPDLDQDLDGDESAAGVLSCGAPSLGWTQTNGDCNDSNATIFDGAPESCNSVDNDCDGTADNNAIDQTAWFTDADGDLYGDDATIVYACEAPWQTVSDGGDCDDTNTAYNPGVVENDCLDPNDYNCDGLVGAVDGDGDGFFACEECNDTNAAINPDATEICDGVDNDCIDGVDVNATDATVWYPDADTDGFGDDNTLGTWSCAAPMAGWRMNAGDCDDNDGSSNPDGIEVCDNADNDCNGIPDDNALDATYWYLDDDNDGEGTGAPIIECSMVKPGFARNDLDCDDSDNAIHTGANEVCDGADNNCSGGIDDDAIDAQRYYPDNDNDGYGDVFLAEFYDCDPALALAATNNGDCNDTDNAINPGADEHCDAIDHDCSGLPNNNPVDGDVYYADNDFDGYGDEFDAGTLACPGSGVGVIDNTDCDDSLATVNTGILYDFANGIDDNCVDGIDEDGGLLSMALNVQPIFDAECLGACHAPPVASSGMDLTNAYPVVVNVPSDDVPSMFRVTPYDPANSYLWHKLNNTHASVGGTGNQMPAGAAGPPGSGGLPAADLAIIEQWIIDGALP